MKKIKTESKRISSRIGLIIILSFLLVFSQGIASSFAVVTEEEGTAEKALNEDKTVPSFRPDELLIKLKPESKRRLKTPEKINPLDTGIAELDTLNASVQATGFEQLAKPSQKSLNDHALFLWYKLTFKSPSGKKTINRKDTLEYAQFQEVLMRYKKNPHIQLAEPNYTVEAYAVPNDPYYSSTGSWGQSYPDMWGMQKINAAGAWDQTTGANTIVVADIDTGTDRNHQDLANNMWVNTKEIPGNGKDDDGNGYVDDYYGWNWVANSGDPMDDNGHGTHTAGTIAAVGNNSVGVVGVNWSGRIMALKFLDAYGSGYLDKGVKALQYAADMGARVSSNSWGCSCTSQAMDDAAKYEHDRGMVMVAAAGNSNTDAIGFSPADADDAVTVAATDYTDTKAWFSNYGEKIDVAAPGVDVLSTRSSLDTLCAPRNAIVGTYYCRLSGTSMATPHVAGLATLLLAKNPLLTNEEVRQIIRLAADDLGTAGKDAYYGYGRINAANTLALASTHPLTPYISSPRSRATIFGTSVQITGTINGPNFASYKLELGAGWAPTSWTLILTSTTQVQNSVLATVDTTKLAEGNYIFRLTAFDISGKSYQFQVEGVVVDNFDAAITFPASLVSLGSTDILGTALTKNGIPFANYTVEWGVGGAPTAWFTSGITLANGGLSPVQSGKLATWDTSNLTDGQWYTLRLTVNSSIGASYQVTSQAKADKDLVKGWPKVFPNSVCYCDLTPVLADLNGDGTKEFILGAPDGKLYVYRKDGTNFPGFPVTLLAYPGYFNLGVTVDDIDGDGKKEILLSGINSGKIFIVRSDGTLYPGWPQPVVNTWGHAPVIADLDGDGKKDIVAMEVNTYVDRTDFILHAYHLNGSELAGFPSRNTFPPTGFSSGQLYPTSYIGDISIADLDRDGKPEIAFAFSNVLLLFDNTGKILPGWPFYTPLYNNKIMVFYSAPASGDVLGDGTRVVFAAASGVGCLQCDTQLYALKKDGTSLPGWPKGDQSDGIKVPWYVYSTPSFADMDNDGKDEIIAGLGNLAIFDVEGKKPLLNSPLVSAQPALADVDGDGQLEYGISYYNDFAVVKQNGTGFSKYWEKITTDITFDPVVMADMDNNGKLEFAVINRPQQWSSVDNSLNFSGYLWEIPNTAWAKYEWPMFSHDSSRSGRLPLSPTGPDTIPPITSITSPANNSYVKGSTTVTVDAYDNIGVTKVEFYRNGILADFKTSSPYNFVWDTKSVADGKYSLQSKAYDAAGNSGSSSVISVTVDNTAPSVSLTSPANGATISGTVAVSAAAADNNSVQRVDFYRDAGILLGSANVSPYSISWDSATATNATHTLYATAIDAAGNSANSQNITITTSNIDNTAPTVSITSPSDGALVTKATTVTISASAADNVGVTKVEFYVNSNLMCTDSITPYTCAWKVPNPRARTYKLQAKAYDFSGNTGVSAVITVFSTR